MEVQATIDGQSVAIAMRMLAKTNPDLVRELRKQLRGALAPVSKKVAGAYPTQTDLAGFQQAYNKWAWGSVKGRVAITSGRRKGASSLVRIQMVYSQATPYVVDMIGQVSQGRTPQGQVLYQALQRRFPSWPKGGRVFYKAFREEGKDIYSVAEKIMRAWESKVSEKYP